MTFADIPNGERVFLDANTLIYHFAAHPTFGAACTALLDRIDRNEIAAATTSHVLAEVTHRLMTAEAIATFGWPAQGIATRMRNHPAEVGTLTRHRSALDELALFPIQTISLDRQHVSVAVDLTRQYGLLVNDAIVVAVMAREGISALASNDADFDRVPTVTRYAPG